MARLDDDIQLLYPPARLGTVGQFFSGRPRVGDFDDTPILCHATLQPYWQFLNPSTSFLRTPNSISIISQRSAGPTRRRRVGSIQTTIISSSKRWCNEDRKVYKLFNADKSCGHHIGPSLGKAGLLPMSALHKGQSRLSCHCPLPYRSLLYICAFSGYPGNTLQYFEQQC